MKKSEFKKELEIAKATLDLAMIALRLASKKRFSIGADILSKNSADKNVFIPKGERVISDKTVMPSFEVEKLIKKLKENQTIIPKPDPQAGDKIVESEHPDYVCIKDFDFVFKAKNGQTLRYCKDASNYGRPYYFNVDDMNNGIYPFSLFKANPTHFQKVEPKKETPLADLNKEGQEAKEKHMDLEANWNNPTVEEMANRLIDQCMPLVNGWVLNEPRNTATDVRLEGVPWSWSIPNRRKNAIKVAILLSKNLTFFNEHSKVDMFAVKALLQKMLSE